MVEVSITSRDDDAAAWYNDGVIYINVRWLQLEEEAEWFIDESFIHEYVEHVLGLGHESAVFVENVLRDNLYREWYGVNPTQMLYSSPSSIQASRASLQPEREVLQPHV
ncbi:hypothetical protein [Pyrodictium abyssi]|uniref:Uncharacterized protein n=1 Tax=Pyrodictium abyssi TaxID=54256 RepID=A0ABN6ZLW4_9CREN|nr:hypothetical protein PABY_07890 [Pyrodictium abyssi]